MIEHIKNFFTNVPNLLLSLVLAVTVWISAVTSTDPVEEQTFPNPIEIELVGKDPDVVVLNDYPDSISISLSAPSSLWDELTRAQPPIRAVVDLAGLETGTYVLPVSIQIGVGPVRIISYAPETISITLDSIITRTFDIEVKKNGEPGVGFQAEDLTMNIETARVSGPASYVNMIKELQVTLDIDNAQETIEQSLSLNAIDSAGEIVENVSISPATVDITQEISQKGGFRNVVVKVITTGQIASGYRVTNIFVSPPTVTVFSSNPDLVEQLPGYVETALLDLTNLKDDLNVNLSLNLPDGVSLIGDQSVEVQVGVAAIEGSITIENMPVEVIGLTEGLAVEISPESIDVILSGPLPVLESITTNDIRVYLEVLEEEEGTYQRTPSVEINVEDVVVESILPYSLEVVITRDYSSGAIETVKEEEIAQTATQTPEPTITPTLERTPSGMIN